MRKTILAVVFILSSIGAFGQVVTKLTSFYIKDKEISNIVNLDTSTALILLYNPNMLWRTDGTITGTYPIHIFGGSTQFPPLCNILGVINGKAIMLVYSGSIGRELWVSDGTSGGTKLLIDFVPGYDGLVKDFHSWTWSINIDNNIYFLSSVKNVLKLMKTDGTPTGTNILIDNIATGSVQNTPSIFLNGDFIYFIFSGKFYKINYKTKDIFSISYNSASSIADIISISDSTILVLYNQYPPTKSFLSKFNFLSNQFDDIKNFKGLFTKGAGYFYKFNNQIYFVADSASTGNIDLYKTDGTVNGTHLLVPLKIKTYNRRFIELEDKFWFFSYDDPIYKLNSIDNLNNIKEELECVKINGGSGTIGVLENNLFLAGAFSQTGSDSEPHSFHPPSGKLTKLADIGNGDSYASNFTKLKENHYLFSAITPDSFLTLFLIKALPTQTYSKPSDNLITVFPNPSNQGWNVDLKDLNQYHEIKYTIVNIQGINVKKGVLTNSNSYIDGSELANGVYYLHINSKSIRETHMLIKH